MKNWIFALLGIGFIGLVAFQAKRQPPKSYTVTLTLDQWNGLINGVENVKNRLKISELPSKDVTLINDSLLTAIQSEFARQINQQLQAENKKDTTKPKK